MGHEHIAARREAGDRALVQFRQDLQVFAVEELVWDLGCNVPAYIRAAILFEFARRGINPEDAKRVHGRGRCRDDRRR